MEWGKEEEKETLKAGVTVIATAVKLRDGRKGRIICVKANVGGKIGSKVRAIPSSVARFSKTDPMDTLIVDHAASDH